jgi:hypothetical protein
MTHLYLQRKTTDEGEVLALVFSNEPLPERALDDRQKLTQLAKKRAFLGLTAEIDASGEMKRTELLHDDGNFSGSWRFEPPTGKQTNTAGRIFIEEPREFFGKPYFVDVNFKTESAKANAWSGSPFLQTKATGLAVGQAGGWMERKGKKTEFPHVIALNKTDLFGDSGERSLLLSVKLVPDETLAEPVGLEQRLHREGIEFLRVGIDGKGEVQSVMAPTEEGSMSFSSNQWNLELVKKTASAIEGYLETLEESKEASEYPRFKIKFHAAIRKVGADEPVTAETGKPVAKDGGEPGKAYRDFAKALKNAKTIEELLPLRIAAMAKQLTSVPESHRSAMLGFLKQQAGEPLKIVGGFENEKQATLWVAGKQSGESVVGRVNVHREAGVWKLGMESFRMGNLAEK